MQLSLPVRTRAHSPPIAAQQHSLLVPPSRLPVFIARLCQACQDWLLFRPARRWDGGMHCGSGQGRLLGLVAPLFPIAPALGGGTRSFRFWIDEVLWSQGQAAVGLIDQVLVELGGVRTGGLPRPSQPPRHDSGQTLDDVVNVLQASTSGRDQASGPVPRGLGCQHLSRWDVLWSKSTQALAAARALRPGQLVSAVVGLNCLTMKKRMLLTLTAEYGEAAFSITPRSFALPEQLSQWQVWLQLQPNGGVDNLWILKTGQDAGKGLLLLPANEALALAKQRATSSPAASSSTSSTDVGKSRKYQLQVAQQYVMRPQLLVGRKWHLRLWLVVTGIAPLRAYLHRRGLVLFSSEVYDAAHANEGVAGSGHLARGHVTNYARNADSMVWDLGRLQDSLGTQAFQRLWHAVVDATARAVHAAHRPMREAHAWLQPSVQDYGFQMVGADYLVDDAMHPWLLEFNSAPSIMARHADPATQSMIAEQKGTMLRDMAGLVLHRVRRGGGTGGGGGGDGGREGTEGGDDVGGVGSGGAGRGDSSTLGDFVPLMSHFPAAHDGRAIGRKS